ncbi:ty3-gypsy sub-class retrotransposonable element polyprotein [Cucumis melo var. makuwa]|uniref:Ty3-gypsy sub-class retrotransposonable element polyprotein n=1 Tax=Cucumis melo var. makuwa TaxID=1194695 RepID=A0A5D3CCB7_CUCMM|nr:ty3-gypsy sub-class retrotransposonable element polyprotein [Cucumis melo var. makuwa]TYK08838.1 ty3-gypsy sub-class retrotransposonable element polyprotein [Cucumis melo var. makuwa]
MHVDSILFELDGLDILLGMNFLTKYNVVLDCFNKKVMDSWALKDDPSKVPIIYEYLDVFLDELSGLPPKREIEFTIEVAP